MQDPDSALAGRRALVFGLAALSWGGAALAVAAALGAWSPLRLLVLALFLLGAPWTLLMFWNSAIGLVLLLRARPAPTPSEAPSEAPIEAPVALCVAIRNEDPARVLARVEAMLGSLDETGWLHRFAVHILSDSDAAHGPAEASAVEALGNHLGHPGLLHYRRRTTNEGFKAGNLQAFARTAVGTYELMVVLDADSLMSGPAMLRMVRAMQAEPRLGILQTLVVGRPADSAFARIFQFGMRHGMRSHTAGAAWWQGPSGPFWGHNAILRIRPFVAHCALPLLPGRPPFGGPVLSHDQVEAVLIRAAGWEVRVLADECGSWEENPPSLPDFIRRTLRWAQGNLQYVHLVARPGLRPMGRFQLANALLMYVGPVAWTAMLLVATTGALHDPVLPAVAFGAYLLVTALGFLPRAFGVVDALAREPSRRRYGGAARLLAGCLADAVGTVLILPVVMLSEAAFVVGMLLGRRVGWGTQQRDERTVPVREAVAMLWMQAAAGLGGAAWLAVAAPHALAWAAPVLLAWIVAVPYACLSADPRCGRWMRRRGLCAVPDEFDPDPVLRRLGAAPLTAAKALQPAG